MSMVFGVHAEAGQGLHDQNSYKANDAFDHIDQPDPETRPTQPHNGINRNPKDRMPVINRAANKHVIEQVNIPANSAVKILGSQKGRQWVMVQCPTGAAAAVVLSHNADTLEEGTPNGWVLTAGGQPITFPSEAKIYAISATPGTPTSLNLAQGFFLSDET